VCLSGFVDPCLPSAGRRPTSCGNTQLAEHSIFIRPKKCVYVIPDKEEPKYVARPRAPVVSRDANAMYEKRWLVLLVLISQQRISFELFMYCAIPRGAWGDAFCSARGATRGGSVNIECQVS
jgi:hypothetical protein